MIFIRVDEYIVYAVVLYYYKPYSKLCICVVVISFALWSAVC